MRLYLFVSFFYFLILNYGVDLIFNTSFVNKGLGVTSTKTDSYGFGLTEEEANVLKLKTQDELLLIVDSIAEKTASEEMPPETWKKYRSLNAVDSVFIKDSYNRSVYFGGTEFKQDSTKVKTLAVTIKEEYDSAEVDDIRYPLKTLKKIHDDPSLAREIEAKDSLDRNFMDTYFHVNMLQFQSVLKYGTVHEKKNFISSKLKSMLNLASYSMFLIMPVAALIFFLFYYRKYKKFYEHFVHAVSLHTFIFLTLSVLLAVVTLFSSKVDENWSFLISVWVVLLWIYQTFYFINSVYVFYRTSLAGAVIKSMIMSFIYFNILTFIVALIMAAAILI